MTTKTQGDRLLRASAAMLAGLDERRYLGTKTRALLDLVEEIAPGRVAREKLHLKNERARIKEANRWLGPVPAWAKRLVNKHAPDLVSLQWKTSAGTLSSGFCSFGAGTIVLRAGPNDEEQKAILLHEIAHTKHRYGEDPHSDAFWDRLYKLAVAERHVEWVAARSTNGFKLAQRRARKQRAAAAGRA